MVTQWKERMDWFWGPTVAASAGDAKLYSKLIRVRFGQRRRVLCLFPSSCSRVLKQDVSGLVCLLIGRQDSLLFLATHFWMSGFQRSPVTVSLIHIIVEMRYWNMKPSYRRFYVEVLSILVAVNCASRRTFQNIRTASVYVNVAIYCSSHFLLLSDCRSSSH